MNAVVKSFLLVLAAALASAFLGGLFACAIAVVSPDFVRGLFAPQASESIVRFAAAAGMIWGLFLGTGVMGFTLLVAALHRLAKSLETRRPGGGSTTA